LSDEPPFQQISEESTVGRGLASLGVDMTRARIVVIKKMIDLLMIVLRR
jgi:hypothetical protein